MPLTISTWIAWAAGHCTQQCGVACCHVMTRHPKSEGRTFCFESLSLIVLMSHNTISLWFLLMDSWMPPAKYLFWPRKQYPLAFCHKMFIWISFILANHYVSTPSTLGIFFHFTIAVRNPGLIITLWSMNFSPLLFYHRRNVKADVTRCFFVHPLAFWAPVMHRLQGSAGSLPQLHRVMYVKFVENMLVTLKLWTDSFHKFCCCLFQQGCHSRWMGGHFDLHHAWAIFELPNPLLNFLLTHYTLLINTTQFLMNIGCSKNFCI